MPQILRRRPVVIGLAAILVFALWLAFRPELLFVNRHVDDPFPAASASATSFRGAPPLVASLAAVRIRTA